MACAYMKLTLGIYRMSNNDFMSVLPEVFPCQKRHTNMDSILNGYGAAIFLKFRIASCDTENVFV